MLRTILIGLLVTISCHASDTDEREPLLERTQAGSVPIGLEVVCINNDQSEQNLDLSGQGMHSLSGLTLQQRMPRGILLPLIQYTMGPSTLWLPKDVWLKVLRLLPLADLWRIRLLNNSFHLLVTMVSEPIEEKRILDEHRIRFLVQDRFRAEIITPDLKPPLLVERLHRKTLLLNSPMAIILNNRQEMRERMAEYLPGLWRMRFLPGMNQEQLKFLMVDAGLDTHKGFLENLDARRIAAPYLNRKKGWGGEIAKNLVFLSLAGGSLALIWTMPARLPSYCEQAYVFPSKYLSTISNTLGDITEDAAIFLTLPVGLYFLTFLASPFDWLYEGGEPRCGWRGRAWGKSLSYKDLRDVIYMRDMRRLNKFSKLVGGILITGLLTVAPLVFFIRSTFIDGPTMMLTGNVTMADYIHSCLKYNLPYVASCCAITADGFLGGSCPFINGDGIKNFDVIIPTAVPYAGILFKQAMVFSMTAVQMLMVYFFILIKLF